MSSSHMVSADLQIVSVMLVDGERYVDRHSSALYFFALYLAMLKETSVGHPVQHLLKTGVT